jgi:hypothetical protein
MKQLRYEPRARFCGNVEWTCAFCGKLNKNRLAYPSWQFECKGRNCSRRFLMGLTFYVRTREGSGGRLLCPADYIPLPGDCFPIVRLREWRRGAPAHEIIIEGEDPLDRLQPGIGESE